VCASCGKTVSVVASRVERTKYCSLECKNTYNSERIEFTCQYPYCGKTFTAKRSASRKYCGKECFYLDRSTPIRPLGLSDLERSKVETLLLQYERMVRFIAYRWYNILMPRCMTVEDFVQEGYIGLITAMQNDDEPERSFASFAYAHIKCAIISEWRKQDQMLRIPESQLRKDAGITTEELDHLKNWTRYCSLEYAETKASMQDTTTHKVQRAIDTTSPVEEHALKREQYTQLEQIIKGLEPRHRRMIIDHYGLSGEAEKPLKHIAAMLNIPVVSNFREFHRGMDQVKRRMYEWEQDRPREEYIKTLTHRYQGFE
jgi:RNA polymerase sigma factor (sigma-70 family)